MTDRITISEHETGLVRLFALDIPIRQAIALRDAPEKLAQMLGVPRLDPDHIEVFDSDDLAGLGLAAYLAEGHGIAEEDLEPNAAQLMQLTGPLMILRSSALPDRPITLTPKAPLRWLASFGEDRPVVPLTGIASASAQGQLSHAAPPAVRAAGSLLVVAIGLIVAALVAIALWLGLS